MIGMIFSRGSLWLIREEQIPEEQGKKSGDYLEYYYNYSQAQWLMPVIPALWKAEVGRSRGQEIQTILANLEKPCLLKKHRNYPGVVVPACNPNYRGLR